MRDRPAVTLDALAGAQGADIARASSSTHRPPRGRRKACSSRPALCQQPAPRACRKARPTTRSWAWSRRCANSTRRAKWCWCPRTSTCASRRARWAWPTDDYQNDKTLDDLDLLYSGALALPRRLLDQARQDGGKLAERPAHLLPHHRARSSPACSSTSSCISSRPASQPVCARDRDPRQDRGAQDAEGLRAPKNAVWGVTTRNREQNFAMNLLMDPEVDFVTLTGTAGTGKTLMALASGLRRCWTTAATPRSS